VGSNEVTLVSSRAQVEAEFVVVGGGSSGAVVAGRLAEAGRDVVLLEAGPDYGMLESGRWPNELVDARVIPLTHDWRYGSGRWTFERARVIGGCSAHNGAIAAVGHRLDYDAWGLPQWTGDEVAATYAIVLDRMRVRAYTRDQAVPFHAQCLEAAEAMGLTIASDLCDLDAGESFGLETVNVVGTTRWNTAFAYLDPVRDRANLRIVDAVLVDRFETSDGGVVVRGVRHGAPFTVAAAMLVLSAGVYGTPAILERSGVGNPAVLRPLAVQVVAPLPGVGANLHDHPMFHADRAVGPRLQDWLDEVAASGFLPEEQTLGKFSSSVADGRYDTHLYPVIASNQTSLLRGRATVEVACLDPASRGSSHIQSSDPAIAPSIDHRYLTDVEGHDLAVLRDGLVHANRMLDHPLVASLLGAPITDGSSDEAIRTQVVHYYHPVGTCRMGLDGDALAVCDTRGRVRGVDGVVVADASLMPVITRANTNMPAVMIGERVAGFLLDDS
jgi:choline dehydrogenase